MLGKVHGPYIRPDGVQFVIVIHHNTDGSVKERKTLTYKKYLKEVSEGKHQYEKYEKPPKTIKLSSSSRKYSRSELETLKRQQLVCSFCLSRSKDQSFKYSHKLDLFFCNRNCKEKYERKQGKKLKVNYYKQFVIPINEKDDEKYFIIIQNEIGNRVARLIPRAKCKTIITQDENQVALFQIVFNIEDSVRVKPVPGFKKHFWISESGVLISRRTKRILSQNITPTGYYTHATRIGGRDGSNHCFKIHRLVGLAFIPNPENKLQINHIDGVKTNNHVSNLEWTTAQENTIHAVELDLITPLRGEQIGTSKLKDREASEIRDLYKTGLFTHKDLGGIYGVNRTTITDCINYKRYSHV